MSSDRGASWSVYRAINRIILLGMIVQFYGAGLGAFGLGFGVHAVLGWILIPVSVLGLLVATGTRRREIVVPAAAVPCLIILQPLLVFVVAEWSLFLTALHPLNGVVIFLVALSAERRLE